MITTNEEWENEYTNSGEWLIHRIKTVSLWGKATDKTIKKYVAEYRWKKQKIQKEDYYTITLYEFKYTEEGEYVEFEIIERRQYKTRNAMMNRMRKLEKEKSK